MSREELIQKLSTIPFCAIPTVVTEDMGLEYDYVTSKGAGSSFGNIGDWPAFKMRGIPVEQWKTIKDKVESQTLEEKDLKNTDLGLLVDNLHDLYGNLYEKYYMDISNTFKSVLTLPDILPEQFFCRIDLVNWGDIPDFYVEEDQFLEAFENYYCCDVTEWDDMSDDELNFWYDRIKDDFSSFPYNSFDENGIDI